MNHSLTFRFCQAAIVADAPGPFPRQAVPAIRPVSVVVLFAEVVAGRHPTDLDRGDAGGVPEAPVAEGKGARGSLSSAWRWG